MQIHFAPLQGFTTATYRKLHHTIWGGVEKYYTPFVRLEKGDFRRKDLNDIAPENNIGTPVIPQMLPGNADELRHMTHLFLSQGYTQADINMGCPFPPIALHGRGSGILPHCDKICEILRATEEFSEMKFSVKMRLGWQSPDDWHNIIDLLNNTPLQHITMHPRTGKMLYKGSVITEQFDEFYKQCKHPVIYNGDIQTIDDIQNIQTKYPKLSGIMLGRGLLARPYLSALITNKIELDTTSIINRTQEFHNAIYDELASTSQGDTQLLSRAHSIWEYFLPHVPRKERKAIIKSSSPAQYLHAVDKMFDAWKDECCNTDML